MAIKKTQKDYFNELLELEDVKGNAELVKFINGRLAQLAKKSSTSKTPTATQKANEGIKANILAEMEKDKLYSITDMNKTLLSCAELSNQKISALVKQLVADGKITRIEDKRKAYFSLV